DRSGRGRRQGALCRQGGRAQPSGRIPAACSGFAARACEHRRSGNRTIVARQGSVIVPLRCGSRDPCYGCRTRASIASTERALNREESMKLVTGAVAVAAGLFGVSAASADVVKVGLIVSFSGAFATWGTQFQEAIQAYQSVNGHTVKGPDGTDHEIQLIYRDAASAGPDKAKQLAEELAVRDKVKFLAGFELSPHAMAVAETAGQAKIPVVIMNAGT